MVWLAFWLNTVFIPLVFAHGGCGSIQSAVDAAREGSTVTVPACIYRESVTISKPLTLVGQPGAELRGSDAWVEWRPVARQNAGQIYQESYQGNLWVSQRTVPSLPNVEAWEPLWTSPPMAGDVAQVFVDGVEQRQIAGYKTTTELPIGQFALDEARHVVLGADPRGHSVEVTTRSRVLTVAASGVTVQGITVQHGAPGYQHGIVEAAGVDKLTLDHVTVVASATSNVAVRGGAHHRLTHVVSQQAGMLGLDLAGDWGGAPMIDTLVSNSEIVDSNTQWFNVGHHAGGMKIVNATGLTIRDNTVTRTNGSGIWLDVGIRDATIEGNLVQDSDRVGIFVEISTGPVRVTGNVIERAGAFGGANWTTCNTTWTGNTFRDMATGLMTRWQDDRTDKPVGCRNASNVQSGNTFDHVDIPTATEQ